MTESIRLALGSLRDEVLGFRVNYPLETVPGADRPGSLRYFVYSDRLFLGDLELDQAGVPMRRYRLLGAQVNPLFIAWWGLHHLERAAREGVERHLDVFQRQVVWLRANAVIRADGAALWPCAFDWQEGRARLRGPWFSAMYQGAIMSALVRGYRLTRDEKLLDLAVAATRVFGLDVMAGGVRTSEAGIVLYEEYPVRPLPRVLDGFLVSLLGLHDVAVETGNREVRRLFEDGVAGLERQIHWWDFRGKWSWYGAHGYLCPPQYHTFNRVLLLVLHELTRSAVLAEVARAWDPRRLSRRDRIEVFVAFVITKNLARLRLPNERGD